MHPEIVQTHWLETKLQTWHTLLVVWWTRQPKESSLRRNKWRHWAIERIGDGAQHLSFQFCDDTVIRDGQRAGLEHVLLDLAHGLGKTSQAGIHVRQFALVCRHKIELNLGGVIQEFGPALESRLDLHRIIWTEASQSGQKNSAFR